MFKVTYKDTKHGREHLVVYDVRYDTSGNTYFLMYVNDTWQLLSADSFKPVKSRDLK